MVEFLTTGTIICTIIILILMIVIVAMPVKRPEGCTCSKYGRVIHHVSADCPLHGIGTSYWEQ